MALVMVFVVNALMFRSFSKALALCQSSVEATVSNTAANFCCSVSTFESICLSYTVRR